MLKVYNYKMQWLLEPNDAYKMIRLLGARAFTCIYLRDLNLNIVDQYNDMVQYRSEVADDVTIKYLRKAIKASKERLTIELVRR